MFHITLFILAICSGIGRAVDTTSDDDFKEYRNQNDSTFGAFNYTQFQPFPKIEKELRNLANQSGEKEEFSLFSIGKTFENHNLWAFKIAEKKNGEKKLIVIDCGAHAREWIAPGTCMYILKQFVSSSDEEISTLKKQYNWVFIPVLNPDGYVYTWYNASTRLWRKNRSVTKEQLRLMKKKENPLCVGVDINRNFDKAWGGPGAPTDDPCYEMFAGDKPFSEKESIALANFLNSTKEDIISYVSLHSYGQSWMTPWGFKSERPKMYSDMRDVAAKAVKAMRNFSGIKYSVGLSHDVLYPNSGNSCDWAYSKLRIPYSYIVEMYPDISLTDMKAFMVPPKRMVKNAEEILVGIKAMAKAITEANINSIPQVSAKGIL